MKVLVVDDEPFICESIKADFKRMGHPREYDVYTAQSVAAARELYFGEEPEFVITDINMPGGSGLILLSEIHRHNPACALLVLSAYDNFEYVRNAFMMGAWDYILKPIAFSELKKCVERLVERISAEQEALLQEKAGQQGQKGGVFGMADVVDYIEQHLSEKLNASEMAGKMAVSYSSFGRQFREYTGMPFSAYLLWRRMERAKDYLEHPHMKIKQVASKVGYRENPQHFSRDFMRQTGLSPKEYRAQALRGDKTAEGREEET